MFARLRLDAIRIVCVGMVRRKHVVVGGDDTEIRRALDFQAKLILPCGGVGVGEVGTAHTIARRRFFRALFDALQITCAAGATALNQALGDGM